jgi:hypothetical protein
VQGLKCVMSRSGANLERLSEMKSYDLVILSWQKAFVSSNMSAGYYCSSFHLLKGITCTGPVKTEIHEEKFMRI